MNGFTAFILPFCSSTLSASRSSEQNRSAVGLSDVSCTTWSIGVKSKLLAAVERDNIIPRKTYNLHAMPYGQAECVDACARIQPLHPSDRAQRDREPDGLAVERGEREVRPDNVQTASLQPRREFRAGLVAIALT